MMPSLFSLAAPADLFQVWFIVYVYLLPVLLYAAWATLSVMDMLQADSSQSRPGAVLLVLLVPLLGGAWYLLTRATTLARPARIAAVLVGFLVWMVPLAAALFLVARPLGPKAL